MRIGKVKGIELKIHYSTLLIVALVGYNASIFFSSFFPFASLIEIITFGIISGVAIMASILIHELAHSLVALRNGIGVEEIEFYFFGGISKIVEEPQDGKTEIKIAIVGPLSSLLIGGILFGLSFLMWPGILLNPLLFYIGVTNIGLGIFNLLPAFPMDGGRVLRAILWKRRDNLISATKTAVKAGRVIGALMIGWGFLQLFFIGTLGGIWMIIIGNLLRNNATQALNQTVIMENLSYISVDQLMSDPYPVLDAEMTIGDAIAFYFMNYQRQHFLVQVDGKITAMLHLEDSTRIPPAQRQKITVRQVMKPLSDLGNIQASSNGKEALMTYQRNKAKGDVLLVLDETEDDVIGFIEGADFRRAVKFMSVKAH